MSEFNCPVVRVKIEPHPNADAIEIARVGDYQSIVKKGQFNDGDLAIYLPEQAVLPEWMLKKMGFWDDAKQKGGLTGSLGNRIRAVKLRGILSQGIMLDGVQDGDKLIVGSQADGLETTCMSEFDTVVLNEFREGDDVAEFLGVKKYEPPLPSHMNARIVGVDFGATHKYDFDNLKKTPNLFDDGEEVVVTEKIHGTFIQIGVVPAASANEKYYKGRVIISSKGMGAKGFVLDHEDETNLYAQAAKKHGLLDKALVEFSGVADRAGRPVFLCGEVFGATPTGAGVQDLTYTGEVLDFRAFDICVGNRGSESYYYWPAFKEVCERLGIPMAPVLYVGPYSKDEVLKHTDGNTTLHGVGARGKEKKAHIREGCVVKSANEHAHPRYGRKIAKSVSEKYLLRKSGTEYN